MGKKRMSTLPFEMLTRIHEIQEIEPDSKYIDRHIGKTYTFAERTLISFLYQFRSPRINFYILVEYILLQKYQLL